MTTPRRRLIRSNSDPSSNNCQQNRDGRLQKVRSRLDRERHGLARWLTRLKRAFHAVEKSQRAISRLERQLGAQEE